MSYWIRMKFDTIVLQVYIQCDSKQEAQLLLGDRATRVVRYVKCSEDSDRMNRKSPFSTTQFSFDAPSPSANICINLILPETTFPGLHFCR